MKFKACIKNVIVLKKCTEVYVPDGLRMHTFVLSNMMDRDDSVVAVFSFCLRCTAFWDFSP